MDEAQSRLQAELDATNTLLDTLIVALFSERPSAYRTAMFAKLRTALDAATASDRAATTRTVARDTLLARIAKLERELRGPEPAAGDDH